MLTPEVNERLEVRTCELEVAWIHFTLPHDED